MAVVCGNAVVLQQVVKGGLGNLPEQQRQRKRPTSSCAAVIASPVSSSSSLNSQTWMRRELKLRAVQGRLSRFEERESVVVASHSQQNGNESQQADKRSRVFDSMRHAAERRTEADKSFEDVDVARAVADIQYSAATSGNSVGKGRAVQPPRFTTLRAFGEAAGDGVVTGEFEGTSVFELIAANIEATKQVKNWEVLSGRLAMLAISVALGVEIFTGNSVFRGIDLQKLEAVAALCAVATLSAGAFAFAWRAKADVVNLMSKSYKTMVESALDSLIDGLFFDES